ncbi:MAG: 2Fe-2S iron-sulfur cluster binding domain-containing protein [Oscillospiraceae bacterium]|jgi:ferredoxin|nr:2Fe-2S iron-sulfur cluster binding domain-containing protein [Oscillospiraceae bacterium]
MAKAYKITVANTGQSFMCSQDEVLLSAMKRARCGPIHYGCFGGGCGVCKMKIISGDVKFVKRMSREHVTLEEEQRGYVLICCVKPLSEVTLVECKK